MKKLIVALMMLLTAACGPVYAGEDWSTTDKWLFGGFVGLQVIDGLQTYEVTKHPDKWYEKNPLYGQHPSAERIIAIKALGTLATYYVLDNYVPPDDRKWALLLLDGMFLQVVGHNHTIGIRIHF